MAKIVEKEINRRVRERREELGYTQKEVAELIGMKQNAYSQMEKEGNISAQRIMNLAVVLKTTTQYLLYGNKENIFDIQAGAKTNLTFNEPAPKFDAVDPLIETITNREKNAIKMLRNIKQEDREEVYRIIKEFHDKKFKKA
ncbi:MAG: helix-turn-helix transcriptional regulator [Clostridia bacterium]|nr:helix-turn-helix transcriptional regulator [Clostridia bacterium]